MLLSMCFQKGIQHCLITVNGGEVSSVMEVPPNHPKIISQLVQFSMETHGNLEIPHVKIVAV